MAALAHLTAMDGGNAGGLQEQSLPGASRHRHFHVHWVRAIRGSASSGCVGAAPRQPLLRCSTSCIPAVEGGEASDKVERLEQHVGSTVAEWVLERVDHQPIAVDAQPLECDGPARDVAAKTLEFVALVVFAHERRVQ